MRRRGFLFILPLIILVVLFILFFRQSTWDGTSRFRFALISKTGVINIAVLVPNKSEIDVAPLAPLEEVEAAHGLGQWKIESLWKLGEQEKVGGSTLVRETLVDNLHIPVEGVWMIQGDNITRWQLAKTLLFDKGDITFSTRLRILSFLVRVPISFRANPLKPSDIVPYAGEPLNNSDDGIITIVNQTSDKSVYISDISKLVENLGGQILDIKDEPQQSGTCTVSGKSLYAKKLASVLECDYIEKTGLQELILKNDFLKRF